MADPRPNVFAERLSMERGRMRAEMVVKQAGGVELGGTLYELAPGADEMPLHIHHGMEELAVILSGHPTLRTLSEESVLEPGDVVAFPRGRKGAHTLVNRTEEPARYLMISTKVMPEIVEYPEQEIVGVMTRPPFHDPDPGDDPADNLRLRFKRSDAQ